MAPSDRRTPALGLFLMFGLWLLAPVSSRLSADDLQDRLDFEVAKQALERGESPLAIRLLQELVATAGDAPERRVYEALIARAEGRVGDYEAGIEAALAESPTEGYGRPWVRDELVHQAAQIRLDRLQEEADVRLEELLNRHYEARGGLERLRSLEQMVIEGRARSGEAELAFRLYRKRPAFYRLDVATPRGLKIDACDGQTAWRIEPVDGGAEASFLPTEEAERLIRQAHFDDVLVRYQSTGERLYLAGSEFLDEREAYRIEIDGPGGSRQAVFLDAQSLLEVRRQVWETPESAPTEISFEQADIDGLPLPVRQTVETPEGRVDYLFEHYDFEQTIDPSFFDLMSVVGKDD